MATEAVAAPPNSIETRVSTLRAKREQIQQGGGKQRIEKQHASKKLTSRERIASLVDRDSFREIGIFARHR